MKRLVYSALALAMLVTMAGYVYAQAVTTHAPARVEPVEAASAGVGVIVPEPATLGLVAIGFAAMFCRRRPRADVAI